MQTQNSGSRGYAYVLRNRCTGTYIHHLDGEPLGVGAAVGVGPRGVGPWPGRRQYVFFQFINQHACKLKTQEAADMFFLGLPL